MAGKYDILIKRARRRCSSPTSGSEWAGACARFFLAVLWPSWRRLGWAMLVHHRPRPGKPIWLLSTPQVI